MLSLNFLHGASHTHLESLTFSRNTYCGDEKLVSAIEQGDKTSMAELYQKYAKSFNYLQSPKT